MVGIVFVGAADVPVQSGLVFAAFWKSVPSRPTVEFQFDTFRGFAPVSALSHAHKNLNSYYRIHFDGCGVDYYLQC